MISETYKLRILMTAMLLFSIMAGISFLLYKANYDPQTSYLPGDDEALWVIGHPGFHIGAHQKPEKAYFYKSFQVQQGKNAVVAQIRAFKTFDVLVNGRRVPVQRQKHPHGWKNKETFDLSPFLFSGLNNITVAVTNDLGPPALWLVIDGVDEKVRTDTSWDVAPNGKALHKATIAGKDFLYPREIENIKPADSILLKFRYIAFAFTLSVGFALVYFWASRRRLQRKDATSVLTPTRMLVALMVFSGICFIHNARLMPLSYGFDSYGHLKYLQFLVENKHLPLPHEGWSMYHPPLFYILSAILYKGFSSVASIGVANYSLQLIPFVSAIGQILLTYLGARILLPHHSKLHILSALMAALLPMNIYISYYFSNEGFAAFLTGLSLVITLKIVSKPAPWSTYLIFAIASGAALLTKVSALPFIAFFTLVILSNDIFINKDGVKLSFLKTGCVGLVVVLVAGWFYTRNLELYGKLFIGNWEKTMGSIWWQDPGYRTIDYYLGFGNVFSRPYFSGIYSLPDSLYSTFWGDGFYGGSASLATAPPWDYPSMSTLYIIAIPATIFMAWGLVSMLRVGLVKCNFSLLLVPGSVIVYFMFMLYLTLTAPMYSSGKAFYGLSLTFSFSLAFAWGFDSIDSWLAAHSKTLPRLLLYGWLGTFVATVFSTFVI